MAMTAAERQALIDALETQITVLSTGINHSDLGRSMDFSGTIANLRAEIERHKAEIRELDGVVDLSVQVFP